MTKRFYGNSELKEFIDIAQDYLDDGHSSRLSVGMAHEDAFGMDEEVDIALCDWARKMIY